MKKKANIRIHLTTPHQADLILQALSPEIKEQTTRRSKVAIERDGSSIIMRVEAQDVSALRATLNSYLRWIGVVKDTYETTKQLLKKDY